MLVRELELDLPIGVDRPNALARIREAIRFRLPPYVKPIRFAITKSDAEHVGCAISGLEALPQLSGITDISIFDFCPRNYENTSWFNVVFLVPTGIGADIGGHAGDATPTARLLAQTCDTLILHPNVVNASDINEMPSNSLYVEGSVITRLLMGTIGLAPSRANRVW